MTQQDDDAEFLRNYALTLRRRQANPDIGVFASECIDVQAPIFVRIADRLSTLESELREARSDSERLTALQRLCGMRRFVSIETNSLGVVISARGMSGIPDVFARGTSLRGALVALRGATPQEEAK